MKPGEQTKVSEVEKLVQSAVIVKLVIARPNATDMTSSHSNLSRAGVAEEAIVASNDIGSLTCIDGMNQGTAETTAANIRLTFLLQEKVATKARRTFARCDSAVAMPRADPTKLPWD